MPEIVATNLCQNPSFETNDDGWTGDNGHGYTGAVTTDVAYSGAASFAVTNDQAVPSVLRAIYKHDTRSPVEDWNIPFAEPAPPIVPGAAYTFACHVTPVDAPHRYAHIRLRWVAATTGNVIEERVSPTTLEGDDWTALTFTATAPTVDYHGQPVTDHALVWVFIDWWDVALGSEWPLYADSATNPGGIDPGEVHHVDALIIEQGTGGPYFDGDTADTDTDAYMWQGAPNASISHHVLLSVPTAPDLCWPVDHTCCADWADYEPSVQHMADALAVQTLRMLTGWRVGGCPVTIRPCRDTCKGQTWRTFPVGWGLRGPMSSWAWGPTLMSGQWVNIGCGCGYDGCSCTTTCDVTLPGEPSSVVSVIQDGVTVDPSAYRLDGRRLLRTDGDCWPLCQNMNAADDAEGAFAVTYYPAAPVDGLGSWAAGRLACEFVRACTGGDCMLPPTVTQVVRQGVTMSLDAGAFHNGLTGIREVDAYILRWNPNLLKAPSAVWSPDVNRGRYSGV